MKIYNIFIKNKKFKYSHSVKFYPYSLFIETDFEDEGFADLAISKVMPTDKNAFTVLLSAEAPFNKTIVIKKS